MWLSTLRMSLLCAALALPASGPRVGERLAPMELDDLRGHAHSTSELVGRRTFVLAMTSSSAEAAMREWGRRADEQLPAGTHQVSLVLLGLTLFIPSELARAQARAMSPPERWSDTWFDVHRDPADAALEKSELPYVFALDEDGRVVAEAHALYCDAEGEPIWASFRAH